jgi:hypothetical protein
MGGRRERMFLGLGQLLKVPKLVEGVEADAPFALFAAVECGEILGYLIGDRSRLFASICHERLERRVGRTCFDRMSRLTSVHGHFSEVAAPMPDVR